MGNISKDALALHKKYQGKLEVCAKCKVSNRQDLSLVYTPGVAEPSRVIAKNKALARKLSWSGRLVAIVSDGSAVLGLGNVGPEAALPVMEGKALLMKQFAGVDAVPIVVNTQDPNEIIKLVKNISPNFAGINLEDIAAPACFQVEDGLRNIGIPVFHDDQHGTAIVVTAALRNAAKVVGKPYDTMRVVILGAGAAGLAITRMLLGLHCFSGSCGRLKKQPSVGDVVVVDTSGALYAGREKQNIYKQAIAGISNNKQIHGDLADVIKGADAVIGVSGRGVITKKMISTMAPKAIVFALSNPTPEIMPEEALRAGAKVVATGRSDFDNQINNVLAFPGLFKAVVDGGLTRISEEMKQGAVDAIVRSVPHPTAHRIIPDPFTRGLSREVAKAVLATK